MNGKNIADFIDPDIEAKLEMLEREEEQLISEREAATMEEEAESDLDSEEEAAVFAIRERKKLTRIQSRMNASENKPIMPRSVRGRGRDRHDAGALDSSEIKKKMDGYGVDTSKMLERGRSMERGRKRERSLTRRAEREAAARQDDDADEDGEDMDVDGMSKGAIKKAKKAKVDRRKREQSLARSHSRPREASQVGLKDDDAVQKVKKMEKLGQKEWQGGSGEGDNRKSVHLVKWMNTGKKRMGTTYCR